MNAVQPGYAVQLGYALPMTLDPLLRTINAHAVPGVEECDVAGRWHSRVVRGGDLVVTVEWGQPGELTLSATGTGGPVVVDEDLVALVRRWLDLDRDVVAADVHLGASALLRPLVRARPGLRVLGSTDGFETAVMTVLGQQVSLAAARTFGGRLVAGLGVPAPAGMRAFPGPEVLASIDAEELRALVGLTRARAATVVSLARAVADGAVQLGQDSDTGVQVRAALLVVPGIGPWTADYLALRVLGDRDAYPADDLVLKRALGVTTGRAAAALSGGWAPWRACAVTHLWTQAVYG
ncbi:DNA-3-methyladenine glycosylase II [Sanguibacter gelidistatuariae]|uniref:DNA-3-methyladenine glycosylase II n=1 Tax=Sanguibacter gelidistatuariae TaxID=1814289 RepID=A0A1G6VP60_9MICO|nr:AlkA N-terminal domain-containing protein [Sanguibacter gelidistatuariae]SDD55321.1 DNA-3-methyladenine glycosylase II [Sanguibacter gelidistatuariae]